MYVNVTIYGIHTWILWEHGRLHHEIYEVLNHCTLKKMGRDLTIFRRTTPGVHLGGVGDLFFFDAIAGNRDNTSNVSQIQQHLGHTLISLIIWNFGDELQGTLCWWWNAITLIMDGASNFSRFCFRQLEAKEIAAAEKVPERWTVDHSGASCTSWKRWFIPLLCLGFNHPFGGAGLLASTVGNYETLHANRD